MADLDRLVLRNLGTHMAFVEEKPPKTPPRHCGFMNEDLECLGCGVKLGCLQHGHCYAVEGEKAKKK